MHHPNDGSGRSHTNIHIRAGDLASATLEMEGRVHRRVRGETATRSNAFATTCKVRYFRTLGALFLSRHSCQALPLYQISPFEKSS